jgi:hypothetical protein
MFSESSTQLVRYEPRRLDDIRIIGCPHPFSNDRIDIEYAAGGSIGQILRELGIYPGENFNAYVAIGDRAIMREWWEYVTPKAGQVVTVRIIPMGPAKGLIGPLLSILLTAAGAELGTAVAIGLGAAVGGLGAAIGGAIGGAFGGIVGKLIGNAITPPPRRQLARSAQTNDPSSFSITGAQNAANKYGPIAKIFGKPPPFYPNFGAEPFTEIIGNDQYLRMLFTPGYGPIEYFVDEFKIGATPLSEFTDVEMELRQGFANDPPLTLFSNSIKEDRFSIKLTFSGNFQTRRSGPDADELSVDIIFPQGLVSFDVQGFKKVRGVNIHIQFSPVGEDNWQTAFLETLEDASASEVRRTRRWTVPHGQYDVRIARTFPPDESFTNEVDSTFWSVLRTVTYVDPISMPGLAKIALRIKASDQLNGIVDRFSIVAQSLLPVWTGTAWETQATRNHAWAQAEVLRSQYGGNKRPVGDSRLDLSTFKQWADKNDAEGRTFDFVLDSRATVPQLTRDIAASSRARKVMKEGKYSVVFDVTQSVAVQHFTPKNSWDYKGSKSFSDLPHGLKVRFKNGSATVPDAVPDEWIVLDDGYSWDYADGRGRVDAFGNPSSLPLAEKFEVLELFGIIDKDIAWKEGRYHIATARLRPEIHEISTDIENLVCTVGDLVRLAHDVPLFGLGWGRIKAVAVDGSGQATGVTLDELFIIEAGKNYSLRIRTAETEFYPSVVNVPGETDSLDFTAPITGDDQPNIGDLAMFGETGLETADMIVKDIIPGPDLSARLVLLDYAPDIQLADTGPIPPFDTKITRPGVFPREPAPPSISQVLSDESVVLTNTDGSQSSRILMTFTYPSAPAQNIQFQGRYRRSIAGADWVVLPYSPFQAREISFFPVDDGLAYDVAVRAIQTTFSLASPWAQVSNNVVVGKTTRPPDVTTFLFEGQTLVWLYPERPNDLDGFLLRRHEGNNRHWGSAAPIHTGVWKESPFFIGDIAQGLQTFLIKAIDGAGNESVEAAVVVRNLGDVEIRNLIISLDQRALDWFGSHNGVVIAGDLVARPVSGLFWSADGNPFWTDDATNFWHGSFWTDDSAPFWHADTQPFWGEQFGDLTYEFTLTPEILDIGARLLLDVDTEGGAWKAEYAAGSDGPFWAKGDDNLFWGNDGDLFWMADPDFQLWPGELIVGNQQYRIRVTVTSGLQGKLLQLIAQLDVADIDEFFNDIVIAAGGTRLPLSRTYRAIKTITYGLQDDGGGAVRVMTLDKQSALVGCFTTSDTLTQGLIDAHVKGY